MSDPKSLTWTELIEQCFVHQNHPVIKADKLKSNIHEMERALDEPNLGKRAKLIKRAGRELAEQVVDIEEYYRRYYSPTVPNPLKYLLIEIIERCSTNSAEPHLNAPGVPKTDK